MHSVAPPDDSKNKDLIICRNFVNKVVFEFIESSALISPTNQKEFKEVFSKEYMKSFKDIIKPHTTPIKPIRSKRKRSQSTSVNSLAKDEAAYSISQYGASAIIEENESIFTTNSTTIADALLVEDRAEALSKVNFESKAEENYK
jgi:hypothetical protein